MEARSTQSVALVVGSGGVARATQSLTLAVTAGEVQARSTQAAALTVAVKAPSARLTRAVALVVAPPPPPARVSQALTLGVGATTTAALATSALALLTTGSSADARLSQALALVVQSTGASQPARLTQALALVVAGTADAATAARATQSLALLVGSALCAADMDGCGRYTLTALRERVLRLLGEDPNDPIYWDGDEIDRYLNDTYAAMARDSKAYQFSESIAVVAGTATYSLDPMTLKLRSVYLDKTPLRNVTPYEMDRLRAGWGFQSKSWGYITSQQSPLTIRLVDTPSDTGTLTVHSVGIPEAMDGRCDTPELPSWCHEGIAFGAAARALGRYGEQQNKGLSQAYGVIYDAYLGTLKSYAESL